MGRKKELKYPRTEEKFWRLTFEELEDKKYLIEEINGEFMKLCEFMMKKHKRPTITVTATKGYVVHQWTVCRNYIGNIVFYRAEVTNKIYDREMAYRRECME